MTVDRVRRWTLAVLAVTVTLVASLLALAVNAATGDERWPGVLDVLRKYAWWSSGALTLLGVALALLVRRLEREPAVAGDPPPPALPAVDDWLVRRAELGEAVHKVVAGRGRAVGLVTSLTGAGGFGKTRLARMVCADRRVRRRFRGRIYLVTVGRDVRGPAEIAAKVNDLIRVITGNAETFTDPDLAGAHLGQLLEQRPRTLLVIDDIWEPEQLAPFLLGAPQCLRLVTTRKARLVEAVGGQTVLVERMTLAESRQVLLQDLDEQALPSGVVVELLAESGRWPLLLRLLNRLIVRETSTGISLEDSVRLAMERLRAEGPTLADESGADAALSAWREKGVEVTIEAAVDLLPARGRRRYRELGIFAEDEHVPVDLVCQLWERSTALAPQEGRALLREMDDLALVTLDPANGRWISLHDVHRDYLRKMLRPAGITTTNDYLVRAVTARLAPAAPLAPGTPDPGRAWWETTSGYLLDHTVAHLIAAGRTDEAEAVASDLRWIERRLRQRGTVAPITDLRQVPTPASATRAVDLSRVAHLLQRTEPEHAVLSVLHSRLHDLAHWRDQTTARSAQITHPRLTNTWPLPDQPHPGLTQVITNYWRDFTLAISPDGAWIVSAGDDKTVRIWDRATGTQTAELTGHTGWVRSVAISPDGAWIVSAGDDKTVRIWDRATGTQTAELTGHTGRVQSVAISPDGAWIIGAGETVRIWDR
ncbi:NB-ARC domain-containing protein, partial [Streptomyces sp. NPDC007164]|uniref:NB-ARC domain-containing protein n=1 Tax=Streptomyces sp. NPDC007164 TaxID=3156918 RepID=UPI0033EE7956